MSGETDLAQIRQAVRQLCDQYGEYYWLQLDRDRGYPSEFVQELSEAGFLNILIPEA
ncbi:MAG: acyl-CoA dehydrogenase, partial [Gammaproteobacteria bacterium]|nr:acyl-CoA dehydrogenase [Gammaproteobacteria bacterium]